MIAVVSYPCRILFKKSSVNFPTSRAKRQIRAAGLSPGTGTGTKKKEESESRQPAPSGGPGPLGAHADYRRSDWRFARDQHEAGIADMEWEGRIAPLRSWTQIIGRMAIVGAAGALLIGMGAFHG